MYRDTITILVANNVIEDQRKQRKLEIKQVEFKLGEDCWDIKDQDTSVCQSTAARRLKVKVLLKIKVKVLLLIEEYSKYFEEYKDWSAIL